MMGTFEGGDEDNDNKKPSNVIRLKNYTDDPTGAPQFALDALNNLNKEIGLVPELGIKQSEVDEEIDHYLKLATTNGISVLEDELEKIQMTDVIVNQENKEEIIQRVGLTTAYLRLSGYDV